MYEDLQCSRERLFANNLSKAKVCYLCGEIFVDEQYVLRLYVSMYNITFMLDVCEHYCLPRKDLRLTRYFTPWNS